MTQEVELSITHAENSEYLYVELSIKKHSSSRIRIKRTVSKLPESITKSFSQWQNAYRVSTDPMAGFRKLDLENLVRSGTSQKKTFSCFDSYESLKEEFNKWLNTEDSWKQIKTYLKDYLNNHEKEIQITIQTSIYILRQLPWDTWSLFTEEFTQAEIALSTSEYEPPTKDWSGPKRQSKVKVLVVLGSDSKITLESDQELIDELENKGAKISYIKQPSLQEFKNELTDSKGWHILFFAGHSATNNNGEGILFLNNNGDYLTINEIEKELNIAIKNGLCLAIFNSCDGLGIANQLADYRIPASIVMKEAVRDEIAIDFLGRFLDYFSGNNSLFLSLRETRTHLRKQYDTKDKYPGSSSLPIIVRNLAVELPSWKDFLSEYQIPNPYRSFLIIISIIGVFGLPLAITWEFGWDKFLFYAKLYPHMVLFPCLFFWSVLYCIYKSYCQIINRKVINRWFRGAFVITIIAFIIEIHGPNMMLFEFNQSAQSTINIQNYPEIKASIKSISHTDIDLSKPFILNRNNLTIDKSDLETAFKKFTELNLEEKLTKEKISNFQKLMEFSVDYDKTWKKQSNWKSLSRRVYYITFSLIVFTAVSFAGFWSQINRIERIVDPGKYARHVVFAQIITLIWISFRGYNVIVIKGLLFGSTGNDWQRVILDPIAIIAVGIISITTLINTKNLNTLGLLLSTAITLAISFWVGIVNTELIDRLFALNNLESINILTWLLYPTIIILCYFLFVFNERPN